MIHKNQFEGKEVFTVWPAMFIIQFVTLNFFMTGEINVLYCYKINSHQMIRKGLKYTFKRVKLSILLKIMYLVV